MQNLELPPRLQGVFFETLWETSKLWALRTPVSMMRFGELARHLDLSVWSSVPGQPRFDLAPSTVMAAPSNHARHWSRICRAPVEYPLELFQKRERWVIVDGYHRLARHSLLESEVVPVRLHPADLWREVRPSTSEQAADSPST